MEKCTEEAEELDLSFGPRTCEKCGYEAEDGYQLDGHFGVNMIRMMKSKWNYSIVKIVIKLFQQ